MTPDQDRDRIDKVATWIFGVLLIGGLLAWLLAPLFGYGEW